MPPHGDGHDLPSFTPWIPDSTQDPAAQIPPNTAMDDMDLETLGFVSPFDDLGSFPWLPPESPQIDFSEMVNFAAPADAPEDRRPWSTDADMPGVNADAPQAAPQVPVGGGGHRDAAPCCATAGTTEIQHLEEEEEEDAQRRFDSWKSDVEQRPLEEVDPLSLTAPDEKLVEAPAPAPEDARPSGTDAGMPVFNEAALLPGLLVSVVPASNRVEEEARRRWFRSFKSAFEQDLSLAQGHTSCWRSGFLEAVYGRYLRGMNMYFNENGDELPGRCDISTDDETWSIVPFRGPDAKGRKPHQGRWKEKSMKGMRAVVDPSSPQPPGQQQGYVGLKKTLQLDDDGNGNKWRAHEYTPLVPSDDGGDKLVPADISLRVEFKEDEPAPSLASSSSKRSRTGAPKDGPKIPVKSPVWEHMTKVHVKVATTNTDGSQRKNPCYKVMFAICHHCDKVFNADSGHGTNNLSKHLDCCHCNCTHSH